MQITDLEDLAIYHETIAKSQAEVAKAMLGDVAAGYRASATKHTQWAAQLRDLITSFETITAKAS